MRKRNSYWNIFFAVRVTFAAAALLCTGVLSAQPIPAPKAEIIAYVFPQDQILKPGDVDARKLTRINYAFANIKDGRMVEGLPSDAQNFATLVAMKRENPSLKVLVSVGGWLWSRGFTDVSLTAESRGVFIDSVVNFIDRYHLDGLDVDWEYPGEAGAGHRFRAADKQNYTLLLKDLRERFNNEEKRLQRRLYLSIAVGGESDFIEHTEMGEVQKYIDTVNVMAYDYYEPNSEKITGNHAPLFTDPADPKKISADRSVREYEAAGVPDQKIVLGVPFYGHMWGSVGPRNHGLFQPGKTVEDEFAKYGNIRARMLHKGFTRYWDASASAPYLYNPAKRQFVSYEDPESLTLKCKYVLSHHLGGVMFWDYGSDPTGTLLNTIDAQFGVRSANAAGAE